MGNVRHCWRCGKRIQHKTFIRCSYCAVVKRKIRNIETKTTQEMNILKFGEYKEVTK